MANFFDKLTSLSTSYLSNDDSMLDDNALLNDDLKFPATAGSSSDTAVTTSLTTENSSASHMPTQPAVMPTPVGVGDVDESLFTLGRTTESLLRNMRLDVVVMGSREEEMRSMLEKLEDEWRRLKPILKEEREKEKEKEKNRTENKDATVSSEMRRNGVQVPTKTESVGRRDASRSSVDWPSQNASDKNENLLTNRQRRENKGYNRVLSSNSAVEWPDLDGSTRDPDLSNRSNTSTVEESLAELHKMKSKKERTMTIFKQSLFDWGVEDIDELRRSSLASQKTSKMISEAISQLDENDIKPENDLPPAFRLFSKRQIDNESSNNNTMFAKKTSQPEIKANDKNSDAPPWWQFGNNRRRTNSNNQNDVQSVQGRVGADTDGDTVSMGESVNSAPPFQLFGRRGGRRINKSKRHSDGGEIRNEENAFQRFFRKEPNSPTKTVLEIPEDSGAVVAEKNSETNRSKSNSSVQSFRAENGIVPHSRNSNHGGDSQNNSYPMPDAPYHENNSMSDEELTATIASLELKLKGRDSAASTLQQLLSIQTRNLMDLQHEHNYLHSNSYYEFQHNAVEIEALKNKLNSIKVERRRKTRFLEDSQEKKKKAQEREELLKEELECIRTELFRLNMQLSQLERGSADDTDDTNSNHYFLRRHPHQKVVIVSDKGQQTSTQNTKSTAWNTGAYHNRQQATAAGSAVLGSAPKRNNSSNQQHPPMMTYDNGNQPSKRTQSTTAARAGHNSIVCT